METKEIKIGEKVFKFRRLNSRQLMKAEIDFTPFSLNTLTEIPQAGTEEEKKRAQTIAWARMDPEKKADSIRTVDKLLCACLLEPVITPDTIDEELTDLEYNTLVPMLISLCYGGEQELKSFREEGPAANT